MDFQIPKFCAFALLNNHYQISKNEGNQNFKLSAPAWFLQKLVLNQITNYTVPSKYSSKSFDLKLMFLYCMLM